MLAERIAVALWAAVEAAIASGPQRERRTVDRTCARRRRRGRSGWGGCGGGRDRTDRFEALDDLHQLLGGGVVNRGDDREAVERVAHFVVNGQFGLGWIGHCILLIYRRCHIDIGLTAAA